MLEFFSVSLMCGMSLSSLTLPNIESSLQQNSNIRRLDFDLATFDLVGFALATLAARLTISDASLGYSSQRLAMK